MYANLKKFLSTYAAFTSEELDDIASRFKPKKVNTNQFLLTQGEVCKHLIFVEKGCLRLFYPDEEVEVSVWFSFAHSSAIDVQSFISEKPSNYFIQAIEDSEVLLLSKKELNQLYRRHPRMHQMMKNFWEDVVIHLLDRFTALQTTSAEQRYLDLLSKPAYMKTIPLKYLASFIGVTPTSLSRIRTQIRKR